MPNRGPPTTTRAPLTRWARPGPTPPRGHGAAHQRIKKELLAGLADGQLCMEHPAGPGTPPCARPMRHPARCCGGRCFTCRLDLCHRTPRALGGDHTGARLGHARCNRQAGARLRNALYRTPRRTQPLPRW